MTRDMVATLTRTPCAWSHTAQCWASVASGWVATCAASGTACAGPMRGGRPCRWPAPTDPVVRRRRRQRPIVLGQTPKRRAASASGSPASRAPSNRSRRSADYCFMRNPRTDATSLQTAVSERCAPTLADTDFTTQTPQIAQRGRRSLRRYRGPPMAVATGDTRICQCAFTGVAAGETVLDAGLAPVSGRHRPVQARTRPPVNHHPAWLRARPPRRPRRPPSSPDPHGRGCDSGRQISPESPKSASG
jgi:hypothetical protein